jgi:coenzyme F420-0:L-glutamate ligase/coenzyme F420-1:gamma-L-glutamate ligase
MPGLTRARPARIEVIGLTDIPEVLRGSDLAHLALEACARMELDVEDGDAFVFTQKVVSKAEGRVLALADVEPSAVARRFAETWNRDARLVEVALREARRIVRMDQGILITETVHGLVCANSGVDASNVTLDGTVCLLPEDPDRSARALRSALESRTGRRLVTLVTDTFGRPWREGQTNVAIVVDGMEPVEDYRGHADSRGYSLTVTAIAVADEIAAAAELVMRKLDRIPVAVVRGYAWKPGGAGARALVRSRDKDLFR